MTPQQKAAHRNELRSLIEEATVLGRRHNDLFASVIEGPIEGFPGPRPLPQPAGIDDDKPCLTVGGGGRLPAHTVVYLAGDRDDLDAFGKFVHQVFAARIGLPPGVSANAEKGTKAVITMAERIIGSVRAKAFGLPLTVGPYYPRELNALRRLNNRPPDASPYDVAELEEEYIEAARVCEEHQRAGTPTLSYTLDCHLFRGMVGLMNFILGTMEAEEAAPTPPLSPDAPAAPGELGLKLLSLDQAAALVGRVKRSLEHYKTAGKLPDPRIVGSGGKPSMYDWAIMRDWLHRTFDHPLEMLDKAARGIWSDRS